MRAQRQVTQLAGRDHLEDHGRLVRRAVVGRSTQRRHPVSQALMLHQGVDPLGRIGGTCRPVFGPHDEVEAVPWTGQPALGDGTRQCR